MTALKLLLLLVVANSAPVLARDLLGDSFARPLDGGRLWRDGRPLFGRSKTVRGLAAAAAASATAAALTGLGFWFGLWFGLLAMLGDLGSSFIKRRLGLAPGDRASVLDQLPEALLPVAVAVPLLDVGVAEAVLVVMLFALLVIGLSPLLYRLGLRRRPH